MIDELKNNIETQIKIIRELSNFLEESEHASPAERRTLFQVINSLQKRMKFVNNSIPYLVRGISLAKKLPITTISPARKKLKKQPVIESVPTELKVKEKVIATVAIKREDKDVFLEELNISESLIKKLKKRRFKKEKKVPRFKKANPYSKISNKFFLQTAERWIRKGRFKSLSLNLRKSNTNILTASYVSMMFFSIFISIFLGVFALVFFMFFELNFGWPLVSFFKGNYLIRFLRVFWIVLAIPLLTGLSFYFYPNVEKKTLEKRIDQELPFVVIHMGSVAGSGIAPIEIFKIIGLSKEYKYGGQEIRKILNQTNIYGYDLTTSLRNVARTTPSVKLAELLNGMSITIHSGGDIKTFLEKRAESLLLEYRLEREKFTKVAETFMDIYISIVIATPMILLLLLIMISISGIQIGLGIGDLTLAIIGIVSIVNILFLTFLQIKQPGY